MPDPLILVLGAHGQLGHVLPEYLRSLGEVVALDRASADLSQPEALRAVVRQHRPMIIVNAAAYTAVDRAESEPGLAQAVNTLAPGVLAEEAQALGAMLVHYSTDYVFDGLKQSAYVETDAPRPLSSYGQSKLSGERAIAAARGRHLIFRTSWVFGAHGTNFLKTMLRLAAERDRLQVVADQHGAPTSAALISHVTTDVLRIMRAADAGDPRWGTYHLTAAGETSWHLYARYVIEQALQRGIPLKTAPDAVIAISSAEYSTQAVRPANSRLDTTKLRSTFAVELPHWNQGVDKVMDQISLSHR